VRITLAVHCYFPEHFHGTESHTRDLARGLAARGHEVTVLTATFPGEPRRAAPITRHVHDGIPVVVVDKNCWPDARIKDTYDNPALLAMQRDLLAGLRPDLLHVTHLINHTTSLLAAADGLGIPRVATWTDFFGICYNNLLVTATGRACPGPDAQRLGCLGCHLRMEAWQAGRGWLPRAAASRATLPLYARAVAAAVRLPGLRHGPLAGLVGDLRWRPDTLMETARGYRAVMAATPHLVERYAANGCPVPVRLVPFGIDIARPSAPRPPRPAGTPLHVGFIGQISPHKGPDLLLRALARCPAGSVRATLWGGMEADPGFARRLRGLAEGQPARFAGTFAPEAMADVLAGLDVLCIPSRWAENAPMVLLYALATGTPVVAAEAGGMVGVLGAGGETFPIGDDAALARILAGLAADGPRLARLAAGARWPRTVADMVTETEAIYREVLG
jgi:glycosyltransferase involved in cell wall biosynthesis